MPTITETITEAIKTGEGSRGPWQQDVVALDDGQQVRIFTPYDIGDEVESVENNGYTNWRIKNGSQKSTTSKPANTQGGITTDRLLVELTKLKEQADGMEALLVAIAEMVGVDTAAMVAPEPKPKAKPAAKPASNPDVDEPLNIDNIPF